MATLDRQITNTADDGHYWSEWISDDAFNNVLVGEPFGEPAHGAFRFPNITVPKDAIITAAYITLEAAQEQGLTTGSIVSAIRGIAEDDFVQATSDGAWTADHAAHTSASVAWNFATNTTPGTTFQTPSIVSIIQELVNRAGWVSGNAIGIHIDDNGTAGDSCQAFADPDDAGGNEAAILHIEYLVQGSISTPVQASTDDGYGNGTSGVFPFSNNQSEIGVGQVSGSFHSWIVFPAAIPQGATILSAYIALDREYGNDGVSAIISAVDEDDSAPPTTAGQWDADHANHTTATVSWNFAGVDGQNTTSPQNTPSLVSIVQEIVNRPGWSSGNRIQFHIDDNSSEEGQLWDAFELSNPPVLNVVFGAEPAAPFTLEQEGFRFRNDDGDETTATWKAAQDTDINAAPLDIIRLRILTDADGDPASQSLKLQAKRDDEDATEWQDV